ncbi:hypothetical protein [Frondihabitans australicus]|uniref:DUF4175 domain-containing protein n=1 Tax=Frondihabitans australicus TaxID=386892 RepID=A0A495IKE7_9MICO|nr:hypothetical protein [Frondihabitans australicus]RKR76210.1 hypothetical protein C8E83_3375 [Frondihabitans australicus]
MIVSLLWRLLPGPVWFRLLLMLALAAAAVWALFDIVFPWIASDLLPSPDGSIESS